MHLKSSCMESEVHTPVGTTGTKLSYRSTEYKGHLTTETVKTFILYYMLIQTSFMTEISK
jgi:hypothetical protein